MPSPLIRQVPFKALGTVRFFTLPHALAPTSYTGDSLKPAGQGFGGATGISSALGGPAMRPCRYYGVGAKPSASPARARGQRCRELITQGASRPGLSSSTTAGAPCPPAVRAVVAGAGIEPTSTCKGRDRRPAAGAGTPPDVAAPMTITIGHTGPYIHGCECPPGRTDSSCSRIQPGFGADGRRRAFSFPPSEWVRNVKYRSPCHRRAFGIRGQSMGMAQICPAALCHPRPCTPGVRWCRLGRMGNGH